MCEPVSFFEQALDEQGLDAKITHHSNEYNDTFHVSKKIAGETVLFTTSINNNYLGECSQEKRIALAAENVAQKFRDVMTETIQWENKVIEISPYNEPTASCGVCGESVSLSSHSPHNRLCAELSNPQPTPIERESLIESLDAHSEVLLKMYLIGKLREVCKPSCPNGTGSFVRAEQ